MKKRIISVALILSVLFTLFIPTTVSAAPSTLSTEVFDGNSIQDSFTKDDGVAYYKITAEDTKYYKFTFDNQSVEVRTGISIADSFLNLFFGKINIVITDQYDLKLSEFSVRCGYSGNVSLKLNKGSTYYIKVSTNVAGNYRLRINSYTDIGGDSWNTATETLSVGQLISSIDANGDQDWFYFQTDDTSSFYDFNLENISGSSRMYMDVYEYVEGAGQIPLRDTFYISAYSSNTASKQLKLKPNTKYYICIYLESGIGGYQLDINQTLDAVGDTQEDAYKVDTDTKITTALDGNGDTDWYKFTTKAYDAYYYFDIKNLSIRNEYYYLKVVDKDQNELAYKSLYTGYGDMSLNVKLEPNTEYYFKLYGENSTLGNYEFKITDIADKHANEMENATEISPDTLVSENFGGNGDVDWFKFTTKAYDAYYYFDIKNLSIRNEYYYLRVLDEDQNEVGYKSLYTGYGDMSLNVKLEPNTEYYFKLYGENSTLGNYEFKITDIADKHANEMENATEISPDTLVSENFGGNGDVDWFKFTTKAYDAYYYFDIKNLSIRNEYYYLRVLDEDQNEVGYKSLYTGYGDMSLNVKLEPNTEYYFKLYGENSTLGNYEFKITDIADKHANEMENATEISPDTLVSENFGGNGDVDWYKFTTKDYDAFYYIDIENLSIRNEYYYLRVLDEDQNEVGYKSLYTGYGDMSLSVKLSPNTEYYIKLYGEFSTVGNYTITVTPHPDYEGDTKEKAAKISINNSQEAELTADSDIDWFKLDLATDTNVRFYTINESGDSKIFEIYSSTNREVAWMRVYGGETGERSQILDAGQYYIKVSGGAGYYTLAVGNCGSAHKEDYSYIKATTDSDGIKKTFCKSCKAVLKKEAVPAIDKIKLSYTKGTYNGSAKKPTVTVYDVNGDVISSSQYTVTYPKAVNVGTYYLKVTFKGKYEGEKSVKYYVIPQASSKLKIKLSATSYTYNGKTKKPSVKVYTSSGKLISSSNYTVVYPSGRKYVGTYKIKIVFKNNFKGTEYVTFKINPAKTPVTKLVPGKKCLKVYVGKSTSVSGYQIQYSTSKSFKAAKTVTTKSYKTNVVTLKSLGSKRTYYVRVRTYKKVGGKTYYSGWSSYKYKKTK